MIIPDHLGRQILPLIEDISQLHWIYVLCNHHAECEHSTNISKKVKGAFNQIELIYDTLKQTVRRSDIDMTPISIISSAISTNPDELDQSFMYSQLLKEIILDIEYDENAKKTFTDFCRQQYVENDVMLKIIDEFEQNYDCSRAIWWYTKEPFIYSVLNKALRIQDIETTMTMGFFIRDLHRQIQQLHSETHQSAKMVLYRGQGLSDVDLAKIKNSKGGLFSFNNFLSTSIVSEVSLMYADSARYNPDLTGTLFRIEVDPSMSSIPFVPLDNISYYSESEKEILFSMHTVFRIGEMEKIEDRLWQVNLVLTSDTDQQLKYLTDYMRNELGGKTGWHRMANLMHKMDKTEIWLKACKIILNTISLDDQQEFVTVLISILKYAAVTYCIKANSKNVPFDIEMVPEVEQKSLAPNHLELATTYNNIGSSHDWMEDYETALSFYEMILEIQQQFLPLNHTDLATTYNCIGHVYNSMKNYKSAISYFDKALEIQQKSLPADHPDLATTYNSIGDVNRSMEDYSSALLSYKKTLEIRQNFLPPNHPDLATTYNSIGEIHRFMGDHSTALSYFKETLAIQLKSLPHNHSDLITTYNNISEVSEPTDFETIISCYEKILEIMKS
jgi:tetratricopeptide (TPR) repeat protein